MLLLCLTVFVCRILDVSLGTIRTMFTVRGKTWYAGLIGFVELLVWFLVVREALNSDESSIFVALAYALGYATGTIIGSLLSKRLIKTKYEVQIITTNNQQEFKDELKQNGFACTIIDAHGIVEENQKYMLYFVIDSKRFSDLKRIILSYDEDAFITVHEANTFINGYFSTKKAK